MTEKSEKAEKADKTEKTEKKERAPKVEGAPKRKRGEGANVFASNEGGKARPPARLWIRYNKEIRPALQKELGLKNINQVPRIEKVVINMGLGEAITNNKVLEIATAELGAITGQKAVVTRSRKAISNFKLRENMPIGAMVTLRRKNMWEFLDRLISIALPRVRDFRGVSEKAFDGRGNYTLGLKEQIIFPEIDYDRVDKVRGMNISIVTTAGNDVHGKALIEALGVPMRRRTTT